jgi:CHAP domain-containing protein
VRRRRASIRLSGLSLLALATLVGSTPGWPGRASALSTSVIGFGDQGVLTFGDATFYGSPTGQSLSSPIAGMAPTPDGRGYWLFGSDGGVFAFGDAGFHGAAGGLPLQAPVVGMAPTPDGRGYWLVALDGGVFTFGDAKFYGSTGGLHLNRPIVGMAATPDGRGYWLVASDGGVFTFGDANFYGSTGGLPLNGGVVGMAPTPDGRGYWLVAGDGGVFTFGDAPFAGSAGGQHLNGSIASLAATPDGHGYWLASVDGGVFTFGDAVFYGSNGGALPTPPITAIVPTHDGGGYWLLDPDAFATGFGSPGVGPASPSGPAIVAAAASQIGANLANGYLCNPYGPCEEWCALFATWAWNQAGVPIPRYGFTGDIYGWAAQHGAVLSPDSRAAPGEAVLYGTGPANVNSSVHVGIVAQVWPDGAVITIEGDSGPGPPGFHNVTVNGPFLPSDSSDYNGYPVYAFAAP